MRYFGALMLALFASVAMAQAPELLRGQVLDPNGKPVRNKEGLLYLKACKLRLGHHGLPEGEIAEILFAIRTNAEGFLYSFRPVIKTDRPLPEKTVRKLEQLEWEKIERLKGQQVVAWVYLAIPKVGALMTRRFAWTVGKPLPRLSLKPPARLKVRLVYPVLNTVVPWLPFEIHRADDPQAIFPKEAEWLPADEWLSVNGFSVRLKPEEERTLVLPVMPADKIPIKLHFLAPQTEKELPPPLTSGFWLLPYWVFGKEWIGLVEVDRTDPFQFVFIPPRYLLRLPIEMLPMRPLLDAAESLPILRPEPTAEVDLQVVDKQGKPLKALISTSTPNLPAFRALKQLRLPPPPRRLSPEEIQQQLPEEIWKRWEELRESIYSSWLIDPNQPSRKIWLTRWTPLLFRIFTGSRGYERVFAFPLRMRGREERIFVRLQVTLPERESPYIPDIKMERLERNPLTNQPITARSERSEFINWLNNKEPDPFYGWTDKEEQFTFPVLPKGKHNLQAVLGISETAKANLLGIFPPNSISKAPPRLVTLRLQFPDGTPVVGCPVTVLHAGAVRNEITDKHGLIVVEVEGDQLEISAYDLLQQPIPVQLAPDQKRVTVVVPVVLYGRVEGQVLLPDGTTHDRILVTAWRLAKRYGWMIHPEKVAIWRTLPDGRFFGVLPEGFYVFRAESMAESFRDDTFPSLSKPVSIKAGKVTHLKWQLGKRQRWKLEFDYPKDGSSLPTIATLFIRSESGKQVVEQRQQLPLPIAWAEPLAALGDEAMLWDGVAEVSSGFYRITSWDWEGKEFKGVVWVSEKVNNVTLTPSSALPTLTVIGRVVSPEGQPAPYAYVTLYDPDQAMRYFTAVCDENGLFRLTVRVPTKDILERQHLDTLLPNSRHELWLIARKFGYGHSLIRRLPRPRRTYEVVNIGTLMLAAEQILEGQVVDEKGKPFDLANIIMLPVDPNLFSPPPSQATLWQELAAFGIGGVGHLPYAQADTQGRFRVTELRRGCYLLVARASPSWAEGSTHIAYGFVQIPSSSVIVQINELKGVLEVHPKRLSEALPLAEVVLTAPFWIKFARTDASGKFRAENIPIREGAPLLIRLLHRNGIAMTVNPPDHWRYAITLRP